MNYQATPATLLAVLAALALYAMWLARLVKRKQQPTPAHAAPALVAFSIFHAHFWLSPTKGAWLVAAYVLASIASLAFFFGASVVCSGAMRMCSGELCIDKKNKLYSLVSRLPINFEGKSLCSISWLAAILLLLLPAFGALLGVFAMVASCVICFFTGQNVFSVASDIMKLEGWPYTECKMNRYGWWTAPGFYLVIAAILSAIGLGIYSLFTNAGFVSTLKLVLLWAVIVAVFVFVVMTLSTLLVKLLVKDAPEDYSPGDEVAQLKRDLAMESFKDAYNFSMAPVALSLLFFQVFRQKFCPKIRYVEEEL